jgi:hypothetical protein
MIRRLYEPKLGVMPIDINLEGASINSKQQTSRDVGLRPDVFYNGYQIPSEYIEILRIDANGFLPTMILEFTDPTDIMSDLGYPVDDTLISLFIRTTQEGLRPIRADFKILDYSISYEQDGNADKATKIYYITGVMNINEMFISRQEAYISLSSYKVMDEFATRYGLGFATNISNTTDEMTWIRPNQSGIDFIREVTSNAYLSEESFMYSFIDLYMNMNYVDVETEMRESASNFKGLLNPLGQPAAYSNELSSNEIFEPIEIVLTSDEAARQTNMYFNDWKIDNQSTRISLERGYLTRSIFYDIRGNSSGKAGAFRQFDIDSLSTPGVENRAIILKGKPGDDTFYKQHIKYIWGAKIDRDSVHPNYSYVKAQNELNLRTLDKLSVRLTMPQFNFNLFRFQKVRIHFSNNADSNVTTPPQNNSMTGQWLITGISYQYDKLGSTQSVTAIKRELNVQDLSI